MNIELVISRGDSREGPEGAMAPSDFCLAPGLTPQFKRACLAYDVLDQGYLTCGPLKVLMRPSDYFHFSSNNEGYEDEFREIAETHLGRKSTNKSEILGEDLFYEGTPEFWDEY